MALPDYHDEALSKALASLATDPSVIAAIGSLKRQIPTVVQELRDAVIERVPGYTLTGNPHVMPQLASHAVQHPEEIVRLLAGGTVDEFNFVRAHAKLRAEQHFPLEYTLHAYRIGQKVCVRWMQDCILRDVDIQQSSELVLSLTEFAIEYTDAISTVFASAYLSQSQLLADVAGDYRTRLLNILVDGYDESDNRVATLLRESGYLDRQQSYCVAVTRSVDPVEMESPPRARRVVDFIDQLFIDRPVRCLIDIRDNTAVAIFSDVRRRSGWTTPSHSLATIVAQVLRKAGPSVLIGVSDDVPSTSGISAAYRKARHALALARHGRRVVAFADLNYHELLRHLAGDEFLQVVPAWINEFRAADRKVDGALRGTLNAYASTNMNALKAAARLGVHANTVYARFDRIEAITGLHPRQFHGLSELLLLTETVQGQASADRISIPAMTDVLP